MSVFEYSIDFLYDAYRHEHNSKKGENENAIVLLKEHVRLTPQDYK